MHNTTKTFRLIVLCFAILAVIALAKGFQSGSTLALILCGIGVGAAACSLYLVSKLAAAPEENNNP